MAIGALRCWDLFLHDIPVFCNLAIGDAEYIDRNQRLWAPSGVPAMNHHILAVGHHQARLVFEIRRKARDDRLDGRRAIGNQRVVLLVVAAEQAVEDRRVAVDKGACEQRAVEFLVKFAIVGFL